MKIADMPFSQKFFYEGKKYAQFLRAKKRNDGELVCMELPLGPTVVLPLSADVKPLIRS